MKEIVMLLIASMIPISIFGFAALLIYKQVNGWGWFLLCAVLVGGSFKYKYAPNECAPDAKVTENSNGHS